MVSARYDLYLMYVMGAADSRSCVDTWTNNAPRLFAKQESTINSLGPRRSPSTATGFPSEARERQPEPAARELHKDWTRSARSFNMARIQKCTSMPATALQFTELRRRHISE